MKYKLLAVSTEKVINLADYIQAVAAAQFLPHIDGFIEREQILDYDGEPCRVIMNGFFQSNPYQWPPSGKIDPLMISFGLSNTAKWRLLDKRGLEFFKKHEPLGCRDMTTMNVLSERGLQASFSACLTLTLGKKYFSAEKNQQVYFIDPYFEVKNFPNRQNCKEPFKEIKNYYKDRIKNYFYLLGHYRTIKKIADKYPDSLSGTEKLLKLVPFYREYSKMFTKETLTNAEYICMFSPIWRNKFRTNEQLFNAAEELIVSLTKASLVVTSRLQCALPCLSFDTPVIFTQRHIPPTNSSHYFKGLQDLLNVIEWDRDHLISIFPLAGKISHNANKPQNDSQWKPLADQLITRCEEWISLDKDA